MQQRCRALRSWVRYGSSLFMIGVLAGCDAPAPEASTPPAQPSQQLDANKPTGLFREHTAQAQLNFVHFNGMDGRLLMPEMVGAGVALLDFDNDGDLDVYFVQGAALASGDADPVYPPVHQPAHSDRLYENRWIPDGRLEFVDRTRDWVPNFSDYGMGVATLDADGDGWMDVYLANLGRNRLLRNNAGEGLVEIDADDDGAWSTSVAACDLSGDGRQELIVANYLAWQSERRVTCTSSAGRSDYCGPKAYLAQTNQLLVWQRTANQALRFVDRAKQAGLRDRPGSSLGVACADFDLDGRQDFYIANDQMANELWINRQADDAGTDGELLFAEEAALRGAAVNLNGLPEASMGLIADDLDQDGDADLFMTHLIRESNTLYENDGQGYFLDRSQNSGMSQASWMLTGFGLGVDDFDGDGWLDFVVANGAVIRLEERISMGDPHPLDEPDHLFLGNAGLHFTQRPMPPVDPGLAPEHRPGVGRGVAVGDLDNDGDADLVISNNGGPARLLVNTADPGHQRWVGFATAPEQSASALFDARIEVTIQHRQSAPHTLTRLAGSSGSYLSARDARLRFALPENTDSIRYQVRWSHGAVSGGEVRSEDRGTYILLRRPPAPVPSP